MIHSTKDLHRGRYLLLLIGLFTVPFVVLMMVLGSLALPETSLRWSRFAVTALCWIAARVITEAAVRRGRPIWLLKTPPQA